MNSHSHVLSNLLLKMLREEPQVVQGIKKLRALSLVGVHHYLIDKHGKLCDDGSTVSPGAVHLEEQDYD